MTACQRLRNALLPPDKASPTLLRQTLGARPGMFSGLIEFWSDSVHRWHSHYGSQYSDGAFGPIVIHGPIREGAYDIGEDLANGRRSESLH